MNYELKYMRRCLELAVLGEAGAPPNPMVGAVVVAGGRIIGEGFHRRCGGPHAEVNAIASVRERHLLRESTLYVSLEPCAHFGKTPPCADLIIETGIPRVVVGCTDSFAKVDGLGIRKLREAGVEVEVGVLEEECRELNRRFFTFHEKHRPYILLKWAESSDGFIDGHISTALTQTLVHRLRARYAAILVGTDTALQDNPSLTTRLWPGPNPLRITIDRHHRLPADLRLLDDSAETVVYHGESLRDILSDLYRRGIQSLMVEGGRRLLESFIREGLWDEVRIEQSPVPLQGHVPAPPHPEGRRVSQHLIDGHKVTTIRPFH